VNTAGAAPILESNLTLIASRTNSSNYSYVFQNRGYIQSFILQPGSAPGVYEVSVFGRSIPSMII
jgi:hypothetical protein